MLLAHREFPDQLKVAKILPIYKAGDKSQFINCRPISILPSFSKIFEKVVFNRITNYINSKSILSNCQYGFRQNHSTYMALTEMYHSISLAIDKSEYSVGVFVDLSQAFDTLDHTILLQNLTTMASAV